MSATKQSNQAQRWLRTAFIPQDLASTTCKTSAKYSKKTPITLPNTFFLWLCFTWRHALTSKALSNSASRTVKLQKNKQKARRIWHHYNLHVTSYRTAKILLCGQESHCGKIPSRYILTCAMTRFCNNPFHFPFFFSYLHHAHWQVLAIVVQLHMSQWWRVKRMEK